MSNATLDIMGFQQQNKFHTYGPHRIDIYITLYIDNSIKNSL